jgi:DNA-binding beta-propeller fold protein YncE
LPIVAPTGLAMTDEGVLLVADALQGVVHRLDREGNALQPIGRRGRGAGEFVRPLHVAVAADGAIAVADAGRQTVALFDARGEFMFESPDQAGSETVFTLPAGLAFVPDGRFPAFERACRGGTNGEARYRLIVADSLGLRPLALLAWMPEEGSGE